MCMPFLLSILISLTKLEAVSMQVKALNSTVLPSTLTSQGPIRLMATSSQGATCTSLSGSSLYLWPGILYFWQCWHLTCSMCHLTNSPSLFFQDVPWLGDTTWWYQLPLIQEGQFSNCHEWDLSCNRWCCQHCHPVACWCNCLGIMLVELAGFHPAAVVHGCEPNSMDYN